MLSVLLQDILTQAHKDCLSSAKGLPYFEGDFWPKELENITCIKNPNKDRKKAQKKTKKSNSNSTRKNKKSNFPQQGNSLLVKLCKTMEKHKEVRCLTLTLLLKAILDD